MAADINRVTITGRLTRDPDMRQTAAGDPVCRLRVAVNGRGRDEAGEWTDRPAFFDVVAFGRGGEAAGSHLSKGRRVGVDGRLSWREWEDADGARRQAVEVVASEVLFLDSRPSGAGSAAEAAGEPGGGDDIPF
ncbi:MAG: single-stranded DNA-binding protein [Actinomycetota bacterium]